MGVNWFECRKQRGFEARYGIPNSVYMAAIMGGITSSVDTLAGIGRLDLLHHKKQKEWPDIKQNLDFGFRQFLPDNPAKDENPKKKVRNIRHHIKPELHRKERPDITERIKRAADLMNRRTTVAEVRVQDEIETALHIYDDKIIHREKIKERHKREGKAFAAYEPEPLPMECDCNIAWPYTETREIKGVPTRGRTCKCRKTFYSNSALENWR